jgi:uncharacterized CHY-type Zn-finger protein
MSLEFTQRGHRNDLGDWKPGVATCICGAEITFWQPGKDEQCESCQRMFNSGGQQITRMGFEDLPGEDY